MVGNRFIRIRPASLWMEILYTLLRHVTGVRGTRKLCAIKMFLFFFYLNTFCVPILLLLYLLSLCDSSTSFCGCYTTPTHFFILYTFFSNTIISGCRVSFFHFISLPLIVLAFGSLFCRFSVSCRRNY